MRYNRPLSGPQLTGSFDPSVTVIGHRPEQQTLQLSEDRGLCVPQGLEQNTISKPNLQWKINPII